LYGLHIPSKKKFGFSVSTSISNSPLDGGFKCRDNILLLKRLDSSIKLKAKSSSKSELCHDLNEENKDVKKNAKTKNEKNAFYQKFRIESLVRKLEDHSY
jgi:hypothetical protein